MLYTEVVDLVGKSVIVVGSVPEVVHLAISVPEAMLYFDLKSL